jgi:hypothetical protein
LLLSSRGEDSLDMREQQIAAVAGNPPNGLIVGARASDVAA